MMLARKCAGVVGRSWRSRVVQTSGAAVLLRSLTAGSTQSSFRVRETQSRETCLQSREYVLHEQLRESVHARAVTVIDVCFRVVMLVCTYTSVNLRSLVSVKLWHM